MLLPTFPSAPQFHDPTSGCFDALAHAIADAERCLFYQSAEEDERLPWSQDESMVTLTGPWRSSQCFYYDLLADECLSVSRDNLLTEQDIIDNFPLVQAADAKEVSSFVEHQVFDIDLRSEAHNCIDAVWVRKWASRKPPAIKSRLCGRGFLDRQRLPWTGTPVPLLDYLTD